MIGFELQPFYHAKQLLFNIATILPLSSETSALDLAQSLGSTQKRHYAKDNDDRQGLEEVPLGIVEKQRALDADNGAKEDAMRDGCSFEGLGQMVDVGTKEEPLYAS